MSLSVQFFSLLAMIGTGIAAGVVMDLFGTIIAACDKRSFIRRRAFWFELIIWIFLGVVAFWVLMIVRDGAWRMYDPVAQVSGMLLYAAVFHYPFRFIGRLLLVIIIRPIWYFIRLLIMLIQRIIQVIIYILSFITSPVIRLGKAAGKFLQKKGRVLYNREQ
ncbi:spore cortex biosynthesis protein YabQ [Sporosarcina obsidiansis]|uniref:spore cortex biosynthesis protein YabQ n=1 Tax=Sporosarcina obsidiansis TaxID=2660748 RepID=UPI00129B1054|nr:spore cortex biosynthesis protein YabQ [Sporosarcina obsidiansis]